MMSIKQIPYLKIIEQNPESVAIFDGINQLTYQQLHHLSNQIANYLQTQGVTPNTRVGIMTQRGQGMIIGILGILKAGGAYVPLDPSYPPERINYILNHAAIDILLTEHQVSSQLLAGIKEQLPLKTVIFLDEGESLSEINHLTQISQKIWMNFSIEDPNYCNQPNDLMTVLYTSGSTGRPKGVMLNHQGYMNRLEWMQKTFQLRPGERVAQRTSFCFDISVWEIFWTLMEGATICPVDRQIVLNPWEFAQWIKQMQINIMHFVPSLFGEFIRALENESWTFPDLRWLIFSGEALPLSFIQRWIDQYGMTTGLANLYGPTEASIDVTYYLIQERPNEKITSQIPIGKAIDNVYLKILDPQRQPVECGQLGELWIGGIQLAQGYLNDPSKTAASFCSNSFADITGEYLYRTGDLVKELPDGNIEYHGRLDHQIKIRGFRVELGEIESVLTTHPAVREAAVLAIDYGEGQKRLIACLSGEQLNNREIKEYLAQQLPNYMIPQRIQWLESLPKNHNGKLDRQALHTQLTQGNSPSPSSLPVTASVEECLPLGPAQRWLITYFEPPYQWLGYTRFRYHQPLNLDLFQQALYFLRERHPALQTIFVEQEGKWYQQVLKFNHKPACLHFWDGTELTEQQRELKIQAQIMQMSQQILIDRWALAETFIVKVHDHCYEIIMIAHHIIADMLTTGVIFKELWSTYHQLLIGSAVKFDIPSPQSYGDYIRFLLEEDKRGKLDSHIDYWKSQFPNERTTFQIPLDYTHGLNLEASGRHEIFLLTSDQTDLLLSRAKQYYECNIYALLLAPLYQLMARWTKQSWVVISHRSHGRDLGNHQTYWDSIGNFAVNFPVGIRISQQESWENIIQQIKAQFEELPMNGVTYDWISDRLPSYMYPDEKLTPVRANYLGNRSLPTPGVFEFMREDRDSRLSPPEQKRTTLLEFFFSIVDGSLEVRIEYSCNFYSINTINQLGQQYLDLINNLILTSSTQEFIGMIS